MKIDELNRKLGEMKEKMESFQKSTELHPEFNDNEKDEIIEDLGRSLQIKEEEINKLLQMIENFKEILNHFNAEEKYKVEVNKYETERYEKESKEHDACKEIVFENLRTKKNNNNENNFLSEEQISPI